MRMRRSLCVSTLDLSITPTRTDRQPPSPLLRVPAQSVRAIGRCAVSIEKAAERCINVLLELIQSKVNYVVQEAVIVIKVGQASRANHR